MLRVIVVWICLFYGVSVFVLKDELHGNVSPPLTYRAAVYEHAIVLPQSPATSRAEAMENMMVNLRSYEKYANQAGAQGVDILVFPEIGVYGYVHSRQSIGPYLEPIPNPYDEIDWTPCDDPCRYNTSDVQVFLSCLAKNNSLYLVANIGDAQTCVSCDPNCPSNGQYQYNTDVVYDKSGKFIAKYHKQNLFFETQFDEPINPEYVFFDTGFGRFGVFTCFDILFHEPAIPLVEEYNVTDIVFPTAWMDALPFFSAIGYHSSFAVAHNVNVLAANLHNPSARFQGSGIYTPKGANKFCYNRSSTDGELVVSDVEIIRNADRKRRPYVNTKSSGSADVHSFKASEFKSVLFHDWYDFVSLVNPVGNVRVCQKGFCCFLNYDKEDNDIEHYAFGVFNAIHKHHGPYYMQICILLRCASADQQSCGRLQFNATTSFNSFSISGNFSTNYVNPQIILSINGSLELPAKGTWNYQHNTLHGSTLTKPVLSASLVGRMYLRD